MHIKVVLSTLLLSLFFGLIPLRAQTVADRAERIEIKKVKPSKSKTDSLLWPKHKINLTPFSLFSTFHPGLELGYERLHGNRLSTEYHFAVLTSRDNEYARDTDGFMAGFELKYYKTNYKNSRWYYALALEGMKKRHEAELFYTMPSDNEYLTRDRDDYFPRMVTVDKAFFTMTLRVGIQQYITSSLVLEAYTGAGIRYREVDHLNVNNIEGLFHSGRDYQSLDLEYSSNRKVSERVLKLDLNLRLAWTF
ncbi:MAG: hypothetical protein HEP71_27520 [Roseivirga sp.]|nr:hypothetical protein [Roseivirga sp.]